MASSYTLKEEGPRRSRSSSTSNSSTQFEIPTADAPNNTDGDLELQKTETLPAAPLDWDGPEDPDNPRNWNFWQRVFQVMPPALFSFVVTMASPIYTTATQQIQDEFGVSFTVSLVPLTTHTLGFALGPLLAAPMSEMFGRRFVYLITFALFLIFTLASGLSPNITALCIFRFLAGALGGPCLAVGAGTISDIWDVKEAGLAAMFFVMAPFLGSSVAPVFGGLISYQRTWRWTLWLVLAIGGPMFLWFLPMMRESYKPTILRRRATKRGQPLPPRQNGGATLRRVIFITLLRPLRMLVTEPIVIFVSLYTSFIFGVLFLFFAAIPYSYATQYGFDRRESGLVFTSNIIGILLGAFTFGLIDKKIYKPKFEAEIAAGRQIPVEMRLVGAMVGSVGLPVGLFWFAWTCRASVHWIVPTLSLVSFGFGMMLIFLSSVTYMVDTYQYLAAASALAANGLLRYTFGSVFPLFTLQMYQALGIGLATSVLGIIATVMMAVPFVFYRFGKKFRGMSTYETLKG